MSKFMNWWYFHMSNPKVRSGEKGGFKWVFRRFWLEITTLSGNFKARFTAGEHPYGYLIAGKDDSNIEGYCQMLYMVGMLLTTDQVFANDVQKAIKRYDERMLKDNPVVEDALEERMSIEEVKGVQERVEMSEASRRRASRETDKRIKKAVKRENNDA